MPIGTPVRRAPPALDAQCLCLGVGGCFSLLEVFGRFFLSVAWLVLAILVTVFGSKVGRRDGQGMSILTAVGGY